MEDVSWKAAEYTGDSGDILDRNSKLLQCPEADDAHQEHFSDVANRPLLCGGSLTSSQPCLDDSLTDAREGVSLSLRSS